MAATETETRGNPPIPQPHGSQLQTSPKTSNKCSPLQRSFVKNRKFSHISTNYPLATLLSPPPHHNLHSSVLNPLLSRLISSHDQSERASERTTGSLRLRVASRARNLRRGERHYIAVHNGTSQRSGGARDRMRTQTLGLQEGRHSHGQAELSLLCVCAQESFQGVAQGQPPASETS